MTRRLVLLAVLLAGFVAIVAVNRQPWDAYGNDGSYYVHIARHIARGDGFVTRVSLQNQGLHAMPAPANIYPVWPFVLAVAGRAIGFAATSALVTPAIALLALGLLYALANVVARLFGERADVLATLRGVEITCGHVAVALVAMNRGFIDASLQPLTEPLGLALLFASLLALARTLREPAAAGWAAVSGALAAAAYLTRFQLAPLVLVVPLALLCAARSERALRPAFVGSAIAVLLLLLPWLVYLASLPGTLHPMMLFDFAAYRETLDLPPGKTSLGEASLVGSLAQGASSVLESFSPGMRTRRTSYLFAFGPLAAAVPLAALLAVVQRSTCGRWPLSGRAGIVALATVAAAVGMLAPLHLSIAFEARHRLPFVLLIVVALPLLNGAAQRWRSGASRSGRGRIPATAARALLLAVVGASLAHGVQDLHADHQRLLALVPAPQPSDRAAADWLDARSAVVAMVAPQPLAVLTERTGFHWIGCRSDHQELLRLLDRVPVDFVVIRGRHRRCWWVRALGGGATPSASFGSGPDTIAIFPAAAIRDELAAAVARREAVPKERRRRRSPGAKIAPPPPAPAGTTP